MKHCKCTDFPFSPHVPCYKVCTGRILNYARPEELTGIFHIPGPIVEKITEINLRGQAQTLDDYQQLLFSEEFATLNRLFFGLEHNPAALRWLRENMSQSEPVPEEEPVPVS
ncbi:hypothetical protein [Chitinophaga japonensis]|uniref:Uncharacterized protein n=1 Tax=Chitinophaga japonensis TaxID=104662 RepID=A0A562T6M9_CHIJA|nr:hypothetical protein [Chitinophaga japonensis]TWI88928.1 hypothetical protein LX66_3018 [Chitinophaga japonensis]